MFGPLGFPEVIFILVLALLIFGPKRLPEVGRTIGKGVAQFRRATTDLKRTIEREIDLEDERPTRAGRLPAPVPVIPASTVASSPPAPATPAPAPAVELDGAPAPPAGEPPAADAGRGAPEAGGEG